MERLLKLSAYDQEPLVTRQQRDLPHSQLLRNELDQALHGSVCDLELSQIDNTLFLSGRCASFYAKQQAQEWLRRCEPTARIVNEITVGPGLPR